MRRLLGRFIFALMLVTALSTRFVDISIGAEFGRHPAEIIWTAGGLAADYFALDYWVTIPAAFPIGDLERAAGVIGKCLAMQGDSAFAGEASGIRFANLEADLAGNGRLVVTIQTEKTVSHLGVSCIYPGLPSDLPGLESRLRAGLSRLDGSLISGDFSWTVRGRQAGVMSEGTWHDTWARMLTAAKALRRGDRSDGTVVRARSPLLPSPSPALGERINLVMTVQYDQPQQQTTVTLASPNLTH